MCGDFLTKFSQFVGVGDLSKKILKLGVSPQIWAWGRGKFFDMPPLGVVWWRNCTM